MKRLFLLGALVGTLVFQGCYNSGVVHEYKESSGSSTITEIGEDTVGNPVYVREIVIRRGSDIPTYNKIFVRCTSDGKILDGAVSNSYKSGKTTIHHTTF